MKKQVFYQSVLSGLMTLATILSVGCAEEEPSMFTTERIVINCTDSVIDASNSSGSRTRSALESTKIGSSVLTSKTGKKMYFSCTETPWPVEKTTVTRGGKVTTATIGTVGISASVYPVANSYTSAGCGSYFYKEAVTSGTPTNYYWPTPDYRISFFGYSPYNNAAFTVQSAANATGAPTYAYTVPSTISNQLDIMTGQDVDHPGGSSSPVNMTLAHRCSAIHFSITNDRSDAITVNSISIEGVKYTGTLSGSTWTLGGSVNSSSTNPFALTYGSSVAAGATADITGTSNIFMMLPQNLLSGAKLKVVVDDEEFEAELTGTWVSGNEYTYSLSFIEPWEYFLNVTGPTSYTYTGGTNNYSVQSYRQKDDGAVTEAVPWTVTFDTDGDGVFDDSKPSWLTTFTDSGLGSTAATNYTSTVAAQSVSITTGTVGAALRAATPVSDVDLSMVDNAGNERISRTTANCYLVHAPGTYKLPLVYGNAIKNGSTNSSAYNPSGTSSDTFLKPFRNHAGNGITDPYLKNNGATPDGVTLVWQDINGLIKNGSLAIDGDYLRFEIQAESIAEGNAVIAATQSGTIVWSWHIWVTEENLSNTTVVATGSHNYKIAPVNVGWEPIEGAQQEIYTRRTCDVKITQTGTGGESSVFTITQTEGFGTSTPSKKGVCPYYQWGRKDPFIPASAYNANNNRTVFNISGSTTTGIVYRSSTTVSIADNIKAPFYHYYNSKNYSSADNFYYNMWDAENTDINNVTTATNKTIYDPCPPDFCVPTANLFYFLSGSDDPEGSTSIVDTNWDLTNGGKTWTLSGVSIYFPGSGIRTYNSTNLAGVGSSGSYWSATPAAKKSRRAFGVTNGNWNWLDTMPAYGFVIRPVAEE